MIVIQQPRVELSVIVPAHNAGAMIEATIKRLALRLQGKRSEIIVVENGSSDDTGDRCKSVGVAWDQPNIAFSALQSRPGMGNALRTGVAASTGALVLLTADDLPFGFDDLDAAEALAADGPLPPVIIGSKAHPDSDVERGAVRAILTWGFGVARRGILGMRTGDPQGTYIVDGALARAIALHAEEPGFLFTTELAFIVERMGIRPTEVPVRLAADHRAHGSRIAMRDGLVMASGLFRLRMRHNHDEASLASDHLTAALRVGRS